MASIDKLIHEILAPVEQSAARVAPKVLAWFETPDQLDTAAPAWDWFDATVPADGQASGLEITEHQMPMDALCALFGLPLPQPHAPALAA
jgi:hypothetical protein